MPPKPPQLRLRRDSRDRVTHQTARRANFRRKLAATPDIRSHFVDLPPVKIVSVKVGNRPSLKVPPNISKVEMSRLLMNLEAAGNDIETARSWHDTVAEHAKRETVDFRELIGQGTKISGADDRALLAVMKRQAAQKLARSQAVLSRLWHRLHARWGAVRPNGPAPRITTPPRAPMRQRSRRSRILRAVAGKTTSTGDPDPEPESSPLAREGGAVDSCSLIGGAL